MKLVVEFYEVGEFFVSGRYICVNNIKLNCLYLIVVYLIIFVIF